MTDKKNTSSMYELEQGIMECWSITTDLKHIIEYYRTNNSKDINSKNIESVVDLYDIKFDRLFHTFEQCIREMRPRPDQLRRTNQSPIENIGDMEINTDILDPVSVSVDTDL